jgi:hypothetical protein
MEIASCLACSRSLVITDPEHLHCNWCGQTWDTSLILSAYNNFDEAAEVNYNTEQGANKHE